MADQAEALRLLVQEHQERQSQEKVVAIASGKGGVGKTSFCVNFAISLMKYGKRPIILDLDVGFSNVELLLGTKNAHTILDVMDGKSIWDVVNTTPFGLPFLSVGNDLFNLSRYSEEQILLMASEIKKLNERYDIVLLDCGAGLSERMLPILHASDELVLITTPEPTSMSDAYSYIKFLFHSGGLPRTRIVVNQAPSFIAGRATFDKLDLVSTKFLNCTVSNLGVILADRSVSEAIMRQTPFVTQSPRSMASKCVDRITRVYLNVESTEQRETERQTVGLTNFIAKLFRKEY